MRFSTPLAIVALVSLAACFGNKVEKIDVTAAEAAASRWNGSLTTPAAMRGVVQVRGTTWLARDGNRMRAQITVENATRGATHPWHVHRGRCGYDDGVVGSANSYSPLKINNDGKASASATIDEAFPTTGDYFVNVHASADNMQTIVACANLAPPAQL
jgi:hypothetical protein